MALSFRYPNLVKLNSVELTDEGREPLQESRDERANAVELANGTTKKQYKKIAREWTISWKNVSASTSTTIDGKGGHNEIRTIAQVPGTMTFTLQDGINTAENYTVYVTSFSDNIVSRLYGNFRYDISITIKEQ